MTEKFKLDADMVRQLAELLQETDLNEIEYESDNHRIRVARHPRETQVVSVPSSAAPSQAPPPAAAPESSQAPEEHPGAVKSPMVGNVYTAPEPGTPPFVQVGDEVAEGQILLIIEAMKVMNPIKSPRSGKITKILVKDNNPVEFGEVLMIIE